MNIIELAKQAEFTDREIQIAHDNFAKFADLVAAQEREECAKVCETSDRYRGDYFAEQIRARGTARGTT